MSDATAVNQTDNALIRQEKDLATTKKEEKPVVYNAEARNRFAFRVLSGMKRYKTAHIFGPLSDDRYMQWLREFKIKGTEQNMSEESREATVRLWDDLILDVENITYPEGADWKIAIPIAEKLEAMNSFLAVAIAEDLEDVDEVRGLGDDSTETVRTETFFNGDIATQTHELRSIDFELQKKYSRIRQKQFKQDPTRGLHRRAASVQFIPQDEKFGELYDEMIVSMEGFEGGVVPLRFKTTVIDFLFGEKLADQKKSEE